MKNPVEQVSQAVAQAGSMTAAIRTSKDQRTESTSQTQFISFAIGDDQYGVDIMAVREIKGWSEITHLPKQPDYMRGVLNLRGAIVPIVDLRCRFGQGLTEATSLHIVIIVQIGTRPIGLLADRVLDIVSFDVAKIQKIPQIGQLTRNELLSGLVTHEGAMIALIDLTNLVPSAMLNAERENSPDFALKD